MTEAGFINPETKIICPNCNSFIEEIHPGRVDLNNGVMMCPCCKEPVRLPEDLVKRIKSRLNTGKNIDIIG